MAVDFHLHSSFSDDSDTPMEAMIQEGIRRGFSTLCFTEHMDMDFPPGNHPFLVDTAAYHQKFLELKHQYQDQIELLFGVELGLQTHLKDRLTTYLEQWPFDFVIGSSHVVHRQDPYYPEFYIGREESEAYREYFESILANLNTCAPVDTYGHLDYVVRYGPNRNTFYSYNAYQDVLDEILQTLVDRSIGLEINTGGYKYGLSHPNPTEDIIRRYRELGGEIVTIGSDGHAPEHLGYDFHRIPALLKNAGFRYFTVFRERKPYFYPVEEF